MSADFAAIWSMERQAHASRFTGLEPPMSDYAYAQRVANLKRRKADLYAALSNLTPDEMTAYGAYRKAMMSGEVTA